MPSFPVPAPAAPGALFVYGTLQDGVLLRSLLGEVPPSRPALLRGYRRLAVRGATWPAVIPEAGAEVSGRLLEGLSAAALLLLDAYEGPEYVRLQVPVEVSGCLLSVWTYVWADSPDLLEGEWAAPVGMGVD